MPDVAAAHLRALLKAADAPHADLGPLLGLDGPLRVGAADLHALVAGGAPSLSLETDGATLTVTPSDGGATVTLSVAW